MTLDEQIYEALFTDSQLSALVGDRISNSELQQGGAFPQVTFMQVSRSSLLDMGGTIEPYQTRVTIKCAAYSRASAIAVRNAAHAVMIAFRSEGYASNATQFIGEYSMVDPYNTPKLRTITLDYYVWTAVLE